MPMRRLTAGLVFLIGAAASAGAQTIQPLVSEYQSDGRGRVELVNPTDRPLNVVVEAKGFSVDATGEVRDEPLPPQVHLKLSATSVRIPPHQTRYVFYDASSTSRPVWFALYATFSGYPRADFNGLTVQLELPHFVYLLPHERWKLADIDVTGVELDRDGGKLALTVENHGAQFGRIEGVEIKRSSKKVSLPGFPLFPQGRRRIEVAWDEEEKPELVSIKSRDFSLEHKLSLRP
jgi:P pilus assembly chaperone PapD